MYVCVAFCTVFLCCRLRLTTSSKRIWWWWWWLSDSVSLYSSVIFIYLLTTQLVPGCPISYRFPGNEFADKDSPNYDVAYIISLVLLYGHWCKQSCLKWWLFGINFWMWYTLSIRFWQNLLIKISHINTLRHTLTQIHAEAHIHTRTLHRHTRY